MTDFTSTKAGFQRCMKASLTEDAKWYAEATAAPAFYHIFNNKRLDHDEWVKSLDQWSGKIKEYDPIIEEFLRDGDQLAARMTGIIKLDGTSTSFESFLFAKVNAEGKMEYLIERSVWGEAGKEPVEGIS